MTNEQTRQIAEEIAQALQRSLKERSIGGLKSFLKDLAHRQAQAQASAGFTQPPLPEAKSMPVQVRLDYRGNGDPVKPAFFTGKPLSNLNNDFRRKLENMTVEFYAYVIKELKKEWVPIPITSTFRTDEEQANAMIALLNKKDRLASAYAGTDASAYWEIIDASILDGRVSSRLDISALGDETLKGHLLKITNLTNSLEDRKTEVKNMMLYIMKSNNYGYVSAHRVGRAVDISGNFSLVDDLRDFLKFREEGKKYNFKFSEKGKYTDGHLHIGG